MRCVYKPWTWLDEGIHSTTLNKIKSLSYKFDSVSKQLAEMQKTYETLVKEQAKNSAALEAQLMKKTQFIENLFSNMLVAKIANGHDTPAANGKGTTVDISTLSASQQEYIQKQLKAAGAAKKLP